MTVGVLLTSAIGGNHRFARAGGWGLKGVLELLLCGKGEWAEVRGCEACVADAGAKGVLRRVRSGARTMIDEMLPVSFLAWAEGAVRTLPPAEVCSGWGVDRVGLNGVEVSLVLVREVTADGVGGFKIASFCEASVVFALQGEPAHQSAADVSKEDAGPIALLKEVNPGGGEIPLERGSGNDPI